MSPGWAIGKGRIGSQPDPDPLPWYGIIDNRFTEAQTDQRLADSIGVTGQRVGTFARGYSGSNLPTTFASTSVAHAATIAASTPSGTYGAMLNVKRPDWGALAAGSYDGAIASLMNSWPTNIYGEVTINHEPENDGPAPANRTNPTYVTWAEANGPIFCQGVRRFIDVAAPIIRARGLDLKVGTTLMDFSWDNIGGTKRWVDWAWWEGINPANINEVSFGIDAYVKTVNGTPPYGYNLLPRIVETLQHARDVGITSYSLYETAVDRRERNNGDVLVGNDASIAAWIPTYVAGLNALPEIRMVCHFHTPGGPASDQAYLEGPGLAAWANACMSGRRP